jgi:hypothetical protein
VINGGKVKIAIVLLATLPVIAACCAPRRHPFVVHPYPLEVLRLHADVNFTQLERGLIDQAAQDLRTQTGGWLDVQLEYDFDGANTSAELTVENTLVRKESTDLLVLLVAAHKGTGVAGFTYSTKHQTFIVSDMLRTPSQWRSVVAHELLHSAGLRDLKEPRAKNSIMYWLKEGAELPVCMNKWDAVEFCRAHHCDPERLNYCGG